jgi:hypothetical protein
MALDVGIFANNHLTSQDFTIGRKLFGACIACTESATGTCINQRTSAKHWPEIAHGSHHFKIHKSSVKITSFWSWQTRNQCCRRANQDQE